MGGGSDVTFRYPPSWCTVANKLCSKHGECLHLYIGNPSGRDKDKTFFPLLSVISSQGDKELELSSRIHGERLEQNYVFLAVLLFCNFFIECSIQSHKINVTKMIWPTDTVLQPKRLDLLYSSIRTYLG